MDIDVRCKYIITAVNKPITVEISKVGIFGDELAGAQMQLVDADGNIADEWISDGTSHIVTELSAGDYILHEVAAPDGFVIATDIAFSVDIYGKVTIGNIASAVSENGYPYIVMIDDVTKVSISKTDITTGEELPGATLQIIDESGNVVEEWVSTDEAHYIEGKLVAGKEYTLRETIAPDGYVLSTDITFVVNEDGSVTEVVMVDDVTKVKISKRDITNDKELPGAKLQIIDENGEIVEEWVSTDEAHYIEGKLVAGKEYTLRETIAPKGYKIANEIKFTVNSDGSVTEVVMYDEHIPSTPDDGFPKTGDESNVYMALICILIAGAGIVLAHRSKKNNKD